MRPVISAGSEVEVVVAGSGPAGLAIAEACSAHGLHVCCIAPAPRDPWQQTFGAWQDELSAELAARCVAGSYGSALVGFTQAQPLSAVGRTYCRIDTPALQRHLLEACGQRVRLEQDRVEAISPSESGSEVHLASGGVLHAQVIIDASGTGTAHVARVGQSPPAYQSAYGELLEVRGHPFEPDQMVFMDFRDTPAEGPPTFLYALPLSPTRIFVEETSLVRRPPCEFPWLRERLRRRLQGLGVDAVRVLGTERCLIPMGTPLPRGDQQVIAFGSAASLIHPATGYHLARMLGLAPLLAQAIATGLKQGGPVVAARAAYQLLWPAPRRKAWHLYMLGMEVLCHLDLADTSLFLGAFFAAPRAVWQGFLDTTLEPAALMQAMGQVFRQLPGRLRLRLADRCARSPHLWRALWPGR